jgi:hypothetical protein
MGRMFRKGRAAAVGQPYGSLTGNPSGPLFNLGAQGESTCGIGAAAVIWVVHLRSLLSCVQANQQ